MGWRGKARCVGLLILWLLFEPLLRYNDLTVFKMAADRRLGFFKI